MRDDKAYRRIRAEYPDCYNGGVGEWCGPGWQILKARLDVLLELHWRAKDCGAR